MSKFPQELVDEVLGNLCGDRTTLLACSLVHPSWTSPSRRELLRQCVTLRFRSQHINEDDQRFSSLKQLLTRESCLRMNIRSLDLYLNFRQGGLLRSTSLPALLDCLHHVTELHLVILSEDPLPISYQKSFRRILGQQCFRHFSLKTTHLPKLSTSSWASVGLPSMCSIEMEGYSPSSIVPDENQPLVRVPAKKFTLQVCHTSLIAISEWLFDPSILLPIHRLKVSGSYHVALDKLLRLVASSLDVLELEHGTNAHFADSLPLVQTHVSHLPRLRHLTIVRGSIGPLLHKMFADLSSDHHLETVLFKQSHLNSPDSECEAVDELLCQSPLVSLEGVMFEFNHAPSTERGKEFLIRMPVLLGRGLSSIARAT